MNLGDLYGQSYADDRAISCLESGRPLFYARFRVINQSLFDARPILTNTFNISKLIIGAELNKRVDKNGNLTQIHRFAKYATPTLLIGTTIFLVDVTIRIVITRTHNIIFYNTITVQYHTPKGG